MLSGDGLLSIAPPDPFQDALLNTMPQVVQYAELLETSEQVEEEVSQELDPSDTLNADIYQPIFTFFVDDNTNDENETADDLSIDNVGRVQTGDDIAVLSDDSEKDVYGKITATEMIGVEGPTANSPAVPTEDGSMPTQISDVDLSIEYATSIEIRGPPVDVPDSLGTFILSNYATSDGFAKTSGVGGLYQLKAPDLPGLQLDDPDISSWNRQVVYLDFDGAEDVTYNGPVSVEGIDVPAFVAPGELVGSEEAIIAGVLEEVNQLFSDSGVVFTLEEPQADQGYSTIFIGGDDSAFAEYGEFFGLAAQVDVGNKDRGDEASVFSDNILSAIRFNGLAAATSRLAGTIAHEAGHLVGYGHGHVEVGGGLLQSVAEAVYHPHIAFDISGDGSASGTWYTDDPYFLFTPSTAGTATFTHGHGDGDATMKLYDSGSNSLLKTESDSDSSNSMTYSVTAGTEYRLWLDLPWNQTGFSVNIDLPAPPVVSVVLDPHGDAVYPNQWISPSTEGEYWEYTAPGLGNLEIEADSVGGVGWDTDLFIYDADKNLIHSDTGSLDDGDYSTTVTAGQVLYFLVRGDVNDEGNDSTGRYDLYIDGPPLPRQLQVPYFSQGDTGWCWAASMSMVLRYYGYNQHPWQIAADRDKSPDKGLDRLEVGDFEAYLEANFDGGDPDAWERDTFYFIEPLVDRLQEILVSGHPVWVAYWGIPLVQNAHVIVITGFDGSADSDHVYVHDPGDDFAGPEPIQHALTWTDFKQKIEEKGSLGITILHSKTANLIEEPSIASVQVNSPASGNLKFQNSLGGISRALLLRWDGREPYSGYYYEPDSSWSGWTLDSDDLYDNYKYNATQSDTMVLMPSYSNYATSGQTLYLRTRAEIRRASDGYLIKSLLSDVDTAEPFTYEPASRYFVTCPLSDVPVDVYRLAVKLEGNTDNGPSYDLLDQCEFYFGVTASVSSSPPKVDAFDVSPRSVAVGDPVTISYTVSDTGGSGLKQVELWRATDDDGDGEPDWPQDPQGYIAVESISGQSSSGFFEDIPSSSGTYWYGLHAVDNAGQWSAEPYPPGAIVVTAADATPPTVDAFDVSPRAVATGDPVTINYVVSDTGGSGLKQVELWRATDVDGDGEPDWSQSPEGYLYVKLLSGQEDTGYFEDIPGDPDTYWYGLHVVDNAGNWSTEPDPPGPIAVTVVAPHIITNVYELQAMNNNLSGWYELGNDIDASDTRNWNDGAGFLPVGHGYGSSITFTGYFDGNGHTISGLYINRPETDYVGLFGYTSSNEIKDVGLIDIDITGRNHVGGLIGMDSRGGSRLRCYTTGSVVGYSTVGGLIGYSYYSSITDCYSTASVSGDSSLGGLIGSKTRYNAGNVYLYGQVTHSYSSGLVTGEVDGTRIGGLVGYSNGTGWDSCYWDIGRSGQTESAGGLGKTTLEMKWQVTYTFAAYPWDFETVWNINGDVDSPFLRIFAADPQAPPPPQIFGSGTEQDPYIITNIKELQAMNNSLWGWYELGNDIDASVTSSWHGGSGFLPVGHGYDSSVKFGGYFDGNGHTVSGLYINRPETDYVGLFGYTSSNEIKDVGLIDIDITGRNHVGGLIGMDSRGGSRLRCYTTGSVVGYSTVGGLIGYSYYSSITDCYSTASVSGDSSLGGLIGSKTRYNAGNVYLYGQVTHSYSSGLVTGEVDGTRIGGLVGYSNGTGWDSCYWDIGRSGQTESAGGLGKTNMEMMQQSTFVGWDFDSVWNIDEGVSYPLLRVFEDETQVTPSINSVSPAQPQATNGRQNFTIHGSNFDESAAYIKLYDQVGNVHPLSGDRVLSRSTTQIVVNPDFTSNGAGIWQAEVVNSSGQTSSRYYFEVVAVQQGYYRGELTFRAEGATLEETRWIHWPGTDKSGVTIGRGYDLGERDSVSVIQDLIDAGIPQDQAEAIGAAAGLKGEAAGVFVVHNRDSIGPITLVQQKALFDLVYPGYVTQTQSNYEYHRYYDEGVLLQEPLGLPWDSLHWAIQDVLVDFVYQGYGKMEPGYHRPLRAGMNNRFDELINYIDTTEEMSAWEPGRQRIPFLRAFYTDYDEDGVGSTDEQGPLGDDIYYDGNGDAVPDSLQGNATSFHTTTGHYVTLSCPDTSNLSDVRAVGNPSPSDVPTGINMPYGFFDFTVDGIIPGESVAITLHVPDGSVVGSYYKYGPTPDNPANHWYEFMYDGQTGAEIIGDIITLHFVDGLRGDDDLTANGVVVEPGAPVLLLDITINEVDVDTPGVDAAEFIELYDGGVGNTPLNGLVLVLFNGDNDQSYRAFDLDGYSTNAEGYFVIGDPDVPNVDYTSGFSASSSNIQNGADAVALYVGDAADFPNGTPVTTDHLLDSLVYDTNDADDAGLLVLLNAGQPQVNEDGAGDMANHANARIPNGGTRRNTDTYTQQLATPGTSNENQPPTDIQLDSTSVAENQPIGSVVGRISTTDPDTGDTFTYSLVSGTGDEDNASFTISGDQLLTGEVFDFETKNSCSIRVRTTDNDGLSYEEVFTVTMIDVNDAPVAEDNAYVTDEDTTLNVAAPGVMDNDSDVDGNTLNAVLNVGPTNGTVTLNSDGSFTYTPNANFNGTDSFTYYANDGLLDSNVATVMLTVNAVNDTPQIGTDHTNVIVNEGDVAENTGTFSDVDQGDVVSMTASVGTVVPVGTQNGTWSWSSTATDGPSSSQIVTITATNQSGASSQTTFDLIVKNVAPVVTAGPDQSDDEGNAVSFSGSFTDAGSADIHTIEWDFGDGQTTSGILTPDHTYVANGVYTVTLTVTDNDGGMGSDTLTVTVHDLGPTAVLAGDTTLDEGQSGSFDAGGSTSAPDSIAEYKWDWHYDGANFNLSGDTGAGQSHVWNDPGTYTVAVQVTDEDGSVDIAVLTVAVHDITAPVVTVDTLTTADQTPGLSGTVDDAAAIVKVTVGGQTYTATNHGATWTLPDDTIGPALAVGTYDVQVMATDTVGNEGTDDTVNELTIESASQEPQLASDLVSMQASGLRYNRRTGVMSSYITITNTSSQVISGDVHFVINSLSDSNVSLVGGDGATAAGTYFDLTAYLNDGRLDPGESVTIRLDFYNPLRRRFTFEWDLWGRIGV